GALDTGIRGTHRGHRADRRPPGRALPARYRDAPAPAHPAAVSAETIGVYPGSFDPLTIAHLAIAEAAVRRAHLDRIDLALSSVPLGKDDTAQSSVEARANAIRRAARSRRWLAVAVTDAQLIADIA